MDCSDSKAPGTGFVMGEACTDPGFDPNERASYDAFRFGI